MRRRLVLTYVGLLVAVLLAFEVPLAVGYARQETQGLFVSRTVDTARFASMSEPVLLSQRGAALRAEITRADRLFGFAVLVLDADGKTVLTSRRNVPVDEAIVRSPLRRALTGLPQETVPTAWPWRDRPLVVAEPVGSGSQVLGAVVTVSPTDDLRGRVVRQWGLYGLLGLAALAGAVLLTGPVARWTLRPVHDLDVAAHEITAGNLDARVGSASGGPPELRRLARSFDAMADRVEAVLARQRAFVSDASHQLRNPLTSLRLHLEALELAPGSAEAEERAFAVAESERLAAIVDDLLRLARTEVTEADLRPLDVAALAARMATTWHMRLGAVLAVTYDGPASARVSEYPGSVEQVLDVLLDNASGFARQQVDVRVANGEDGWVALVVSDDGPGLSAEHRALATERFWRAPGRQNEPGTGLGLSIAHALVDASRGRMALEEADAGGLAVRVELRRSAL
ncbi:MAG: HAMP domain-containing sensor histidine kinase [Actinomycetes bacterium]